MRKDDFNVECPFTCRGYFDIQIMQRNALKNNVVVKLRKLKNGADVNQKVRD